MQLEGIQQCSRMVSLGPGPVQDPGIQNEGEMVSAEAPGCMRRNRPMPFSEAFQPTEQELKVTEKHALSHTGVPLPLGAIMICVSRAEQASPQIPFFLNSLDGLTYFILSQVLNRPCHTLLRL